MSPVKVKVGNDKEMAQPPLGILRSNSVERRLAERQNFNPCQGWKV